MKWAQNKLNSETEAHKVSDTETVIAYEKHGQSQWNPSLVDTNGTYNVFPV